MTIRSVTTIAAILAVGAALSGTAMAGPCDALGEAVSQRTNAAIVRTDPVSGNIFFRHPAAQEMTLYCAGLEHADWIAFAYDRRPDMRFQALVSVAGAMAVDRPIPGVALRDCLTESMIDPSGVAARAVGGVNFECIFIDPNGSVALSRGGD